MKDLQTRIEGVKKVDFEYIICQKRKKVIQSEEALIHLLCSCKRFVKAWTQATNWKEQACINSRAITVLSSGRLSWRYFFDRIEDIESLSSEKNRLSQSLDHKTKKVLDLETK